MRTRVNITPFDSGESEDSEQPENRKKHTHERAARLNRTDIICKELLLFIE